MTSSKVRKLVGMDAKSKPVRYRCKIWRVRIGVIKAKSHIGNGGSTRTSFERLADLEAPGRAPP